MRPSNRLVGRRMAWRGYLHRSLCLPRWRLKRRCSLEEGKERTFTKWKWIDEIAISRGNSKDFVAIYWYWYWDQQIVASSVPIPRFKYFFHNKPLRVKVYKSFYAFLNFTKNKKQLRNFLGQKWAKSFQTMWVHKFLL